MNENYVKMLEIPVSSSSVVFKPARKKKKDVKKQVIEKVNSNELEVKSETVTVKKSKAIKPLKILSIKRTFKKPDAVSDVVNESKVKKGGFDIVSAQIVAIFVLIVSIIFAKKPVLRRGKGKNKSRPIFGRQKITVGVLLVILVKQFFVVFFDLLVGVAVKNFVVESALIVCLFESGKHLHPVNFAFLGQEVAFSYKVIIGNMYCTDSIAVFRNGFFGFFIIEMVDVYAGVGVFAFGQEIAHFIGRIQEVSACHIFDANFLIRFFR